jgi:threonine dehydrogenase-like Zn-dependent dehydrogenase
MTMKAVAVIPGKANSIHLREVTKPMLNGAAQDVLVKVLRVGIDGTDKEINAAEYGAPPPGDDFLILGHESLGVVESVGTKVSEFKPGDYVVASVRRPGMSIYDGIGLQDMTTDDTYFERGINLRHGYLSEYYAEHSDFLVKVPHGLKGVAVLMEPASVAEKAIAQAYEIQRRLRIWRPRRAAVLGVGTLGLLASLILRLRGLEVVAIGLREPPFLNSELLEEIGARYFSTQQTSLKQAAEEFGPLDIILEGTGYSPLVFEAMQALGKNGVLAMVSISGGSRTAEIPADHINQGFVLGNKVAFGSVNASREDFERAVRDFSQAELSYPGWLSKLLTHPVPGLENFELLMKTLIEAKDAVKVFCEVAPM